MRRTILVLALLLVAVLGAIAVQNARTRAHQTPFGAGRSAQPGR
jgi:hypothetical protein